MELDRVTFSIRRVVMDVLFILVGITIALWLGVLILYAIQTLHYLAVNWSEISKCVQNAT
jgi:hypothetical protein